MTDMDDRKKPKSYDDLYPGRFLKAGNLHGEKVTLTIKDYDLEELEGENGKRKKALIHFREIETALVACKTNGLCLKAMFGAELSKWVGKRVTLFPDVWAGEPCIRVWGSPDIDKEIDVQVQLPRRRPFTKTMHVVKLGGRNGKAAEQSGTANPIADRADAFRRLDTELGNIDAARSDLRAWVIETTGKDVPPVADWSDAMLAWGLKKLGTNGEDLRAWAAASRQSAPPAEGAPESDEMPV